MNYLGQKMTDDLPEPPKIIANDVPSINAEHAFPPKIFYPLGEAAELAKCKSNDLLHYGGMGKIGLVIAPPDGIDCYPINPYTEYLGSPNFEPALLVLKQSYCQRIECNGKTEQSDFPLGYFFDRFGAPNTLHPSLSDKEIAESAWLERSDSLWRTYFQGYPKKIELVPERLFVMSFDLKAFLENSYTPKNELASSTSSGNLQGKSDRLAHLNQAATKFWQNADPMDAATHPDNDQVAHWLITNYGFSDRLADAGATIIRPSFAKVGRKPDTKK